MKAKLLGVTVFEFRVFINEKLQEGYKLVGTLDFPGNWHGFIHLEVSIPWLPIVPDFKYAWEVK